MKLTWFGHSAFALEFADVKIMMDPFLSGNPVFEGNADEVSAGCTHLLLTHGHDDHVGDSLAILEKTGAQLVANFEVCMWLVSQGASGDRINPGNHGGTVDCGGFTTSFVNALHSSGTVKDGASVYLGNPLGLIVKADGEPSVYHMGDTDIFSDMALINELHAPDVGIVPIGDRFTMGAKSAALACRRFFDFKAILPCHYATFPVLDQTADAFVSEMGPDGSKVKVLTPGGDTTVAI
ncbi:MAG TPA: metal-dependent hydrolase [Afifellaceae bacterium]|nr:metal-dependent hydrolase [Afifellaceae bacterium]